MFIIEFCLFSLFLPFFHCGQLISHGIELNYNNAGYATEFRLTFSFTTPFSSSDYIKVVFPFALHSTATNNIPDNLSGSYSTNIGDFHCGSSPTGLINVYIDSQTANSYYIQLLNPQNQPSNSLSTGVFYTLSLTLDETNANIQSTGVKQPIEVYTVSAMSSKAITYDFNTVFAIISLNDYPSADMLLFIQSIDPTRFNLSATYNITLDIFPTKSISDSARFELNFVQTGPGFSFGGICESIAKTTSPTADRLDPAIYTCVKTSDNKLTLSIFNTVQVNMGIRLNISILNPAFVQKNASLQVRSMLSYANTIVEINQTDAIFYTSPMTFSHIKLAMAWGLDTSQSALYPFAMNVIRGDASTPTTFPYNTLRWSLRVVNPTSASTKLQVVLKLSSPQNSMILPGSIVHNFPSFTAQANSAARCYVPSLANPNAFQVTCDSVGQLSATMDYFIGVRMYFPYDQWTQSLGGDFGSFTIYSYAVSVTMQDAFPLFNSAKAVGSIQTSNNPSWFITNGASKYDTTVVSTETPSTLTPNPPDSNVLGLDPSITTPRLVFSMNMIISDVYTSNPVVVPPAATPAATITYGAGLVIMTNPSVYWDGVSSVPLEQMGTPTGGTTTVNVVKYASFNKIVVASDHTSQLLAMYAYDTSVAAPAPANFFSLKNLQIKNQTSLYADYDTLDFYIATFEQLNTAFPAFRKLMLYNAYTIKSSWTSQIRYGIVNYWSQGAANNDGSSYPSFIRLAGYIGTGDVSAAYSGRLALFFNDMNPFYQYSDTSSSDEIACFTTVPGAKCTFFPCSSMAKGQSYQNLNRVEIDLLKSFTGSTGPFEILIPVKSVTATKSFNFFLGFMAQNTDYSSGTYYKLLSVYRLTGGSNLQTNQITFAYGATLGISYFAAGITSANYDIDTTGLTVGQSGVTLSFFAGHTDTTNIFADSGITNGNNAAGFTISSSWNFTTYTSVFTFSVGDAVNLDNSCLAGSYIYAWTGKTPTYRYTMFCPYTTGSVSTSTRFIVSNGKVPYSNGDQLPDDTSFVWSTNTGVIKAYKVNPSSSIPNHPSLTFFSVMPQPKKGFKQNYLQWNFQTVNPFLDGFVVTIVFTPVVTFSLSATGLLCQLKYGNGSYINSKCSVALTSTALSSTLTYTISSCSDCPLANLPLQINNWGINSPVVNGVDTGFYFKIYSALGNLVETSVLNTFSYNNTALANTIILSNLTFASLNKRSRGPLQFTFFMNDRAIWDNEYLVINLGGVAKDNTLNTPNIRCMMLEANQSVSKLWTSIDLTDLTAIAITPKTDINSTNNASFTFYCDGVITPYSYNPSYITMYLQIQGTSSVIKYGDALNIDDGRFFDQYLFNSVSALLINKNYNSPGSYLDFTFNFTCSNQDIDMSNTNFILDFPVYYSPLLTNGLLLCQINNIMASCVVNQARRLLFQYIPVAIPMNTQFTIRVYGIDCPYQFISGSTIFFGIMPNLTSKNLSQFGSIADLAPNSLPLNIQIFSLNISNLYIRSYSNYVFKVNFPAGAISSNRIITVDFPNQWDLIIHYNTPSCQIYNPDMSSQFVTNCTSFGNKVIIYLGSSDVTSNFYYLLVLNNVRNPDNSNCDIMPFFVSVIDLSYNLVSRSHFNQINKNITTYLQNPSEINLRFVDINAGLQVSIFQADIGVYNKFIRVVPDYGIFAETVVLTTSNPSFGLYPSSVSCKFGTKYCQFAIAAVEKTLPGLYNLEILKTENFDYHTRLPFLKVRVSQQIYSLQFEATSYDLPIGGFTLPIKLFFTGIVPQAEVKIDTKFLIGLQGLSFINSSSLLITPDNPKGILLLQADASKTVAGADTILLSQSGSNYDDYTTFPNILLNVFKSTASNNISLVLTNQPPLPTSVTIQASCDQTSTFYYIMAINGSIWRNSTYIKNQALWFTQYNINDPYQEQIGFLNMIATSNTLTQNLALSGIFPNVTYNFSGFCENNVGYRSALQSIIFQAPDNGGILYKMTATYSIALSSGLISSLGCFFNKLYKIPARNIKTVDNIACSNRRLLEIENDDSLGRQLITGNTTSNTSNTSNSSNSTNGTNSTNSTNSTNTTNTSSTSSYYDYNLYFYPSDDMDLDVITPILNANSYDNATLINWILNNITGMPNLLNLSSLSSIDRTPPIINASSFKINATQNTISMTKITLGRPGFLYVALEAIRGNLSNFFTNLTSNLTMFKSLPNNNKNQSLVNYINQYYLQNLTYITWVQIRDGYCSDQSVNVFGSLRFEFNSSTDVISNITFTNLTNSTFYMVSMYATAEDPSYFAQRSDIFKYIQNTTGVQRLTLGTGKNSAFEIVTFICGLIGILIFH